MAVKLLPKIIVVLAVVGAVGFGLNTYLATKTNTPTIAVQNVQEPVQEHQVPVQTQAPVQTPVQEDVQPAEPRNRGLDALMKNKGAK